MTKTLEILYMKTLKYGSRGDDVKLLQRKLNMIESGNFLELTLEAVKTFQAEHNLKVDGVVGPKTWESLGVINNPRKITELFVHCTATPEGKDFDIEDVRRWHTTPVSKGGRGWSDVGYNVLIKLDGTVQVGRNPKLIPAGVAGRNSHSLHVVYVGGLASDGKTPKDTRTEAQKASLIKVLKDWKAQYPNAIILGHRDAANKACPSFDAKTEYKDL